MTIATDRLVVSYESRKRAKDACLAIQRFDEDNGCKIRVYVTGKMFRFYVLEIEYPGYLSEKIEAVVSLAKRVNIDPEFGDDVTEFYQGDGLSRFRGQ